MSLRRPFTFPSLAVGAPVGAKPGERYVFGDSVASVSRRRVVPIVLLVLAAVIALPAVVGLIGSGSGLRAERIDVDGVPVTVIRPDPVPANAPAAVVVHGFAASSVIMEPIGRALARVGYIVALPDVSGHGANPSSLSMDDTVRDELQGDVAAVLGWLADQPEVDPQRLALVGHSMGAGAVTRFAIDNPDAVRATVSISLPSPIDPLNTPRNLLLLYGSAEPAGFANAAHEQLELIRPGAQVGVTYGELPQGTALSAEVIDGVEHISIVWAPATAQMMLTWIGGAVDAPTSPVDLDPAWLWLILLLIAGCLAAIPLARLLYGGDSQPPEARVAGWVAMVVTVVAAVAASVTAAVLGSFADAVIPLAVGGYLAVWFAAAAATIAIAMVWVRRYRRRSYGSFEMRPLVAGLGMTSYAVVVLIVSARLTWASTAFVGPRWWIWIVLSLVLLGYFYADAVIVSRRSWAARLGVMAVNRLVVTLGLLASVVFFDAPSILTLLLPFMVLLFIILGYFAVVVSTRTSGRFGPALVQAVPLAAVVATGFPLT
jgi:dienelactone hydrolase